MSHAEKLCDMICHIDKGPDKLVMVVSFRFDVILIYIKRSPHLHFCKNISITGLPACFLLDFKPTFLNNSAFENNSSD